METINLPPDAAIIMESTRAIGYSLETAVADIIDNSIAAQASEVELIFSSDPDDEFVAIIDDGFGMSGETITTAMQYGSKNPLDDRQTADLGRFGLGLKTASLSQCRRLSVVSKQGNSLEGRCWDIDYVINSKQWSLQILNQVEISKLPCIDLLKEKEQGTVVIWQNLDRLKQGDSNFVENLPKLLDVVRAHLSLVFHKYLSGFAELDKFIIRVNGITLKPRDPFLTKKSTLFRPTETYRNIRISAYILPRESKLDKEEYRELGGDENFTRNQGFYVYRNHRLLTWGTWFGIFRVKEEYKYGRIALDVPNSSDLMWKLDIKKSTATPPPNLKRFLKKIVVKLTNESSKKYNYKGKATNFDEKSENQPMWSRLETPDNTIFYQINREHHLIHEFIEQHQNLKGEFVSILTHIENELPVSFIRQDVQGGNQIDNVEERSYQEVFEQLLEILKKFELNERKNIFEQTILQMPFVIYKQMLINDYEEGVFDEI